MQQVTSATQASELLQIQRIHVAREALLHDQGLAVLSQADEDVALDIAPRGIVQPDQLLYSSTRHRDSAHGLRGVQGFVQVQVPVVGRSCRIGTRMDRQRLPLLRGDAKKAHLALIQRKRRDIPAVRRRPRTEQALGRRHLVDRAGIEV